MSSRSFVPTPIAEAHGPEQLSICLRRQRSGIGGKNSLLNRDVSPGGGGKVQKFKVDNDGGRQALLIV
jgi:hypothetical protein